MKSKRNNKQLSKCRNKRTNKALTKRCKKKVKKRTKIDNKKYNNKKVTFNMIGGDSSYIEVEFEDDKDLIGTIMMKSNILEEEKDLFASMLFDYNQIIGTINWSNDKKFLRYVSVSGKLENNISSESIKTCDSKDIDKCNDNDCMVYIGKTSEKCVPKDSIKLFRIGESIKASKRNTYEIIKIIHITEIIENVKIIFFKRNQLYNGKTIYLILYPYGEVQFIQSKIYTDIINKHISNLYDENPDSMFFLSGHSMGGGMVQQTALNAIEICETTGNNYCNNIRMIMTNSIMYLNPENEVQKFKDKYTGKYVSIGLFIEMYGKKVIDSFLFEIFNNNFDKKLLTNKEQPPNILNTIIIVGVHDKNKIIIKDTILLSEFIKTYDFKNIYIFLVKAIHDYNSIMKPIILSLV
jgi:hypothetical protein